MENHQKIAKILADIWEKKDLDLLRQNLADNIEWYEGPYAKALKSKDAVVNQWVKDLTGQEDIKVKIELFAAENQKGSYHFQASFSDAKRGTIELDGIFFVRLNNDGKIEYFNQWYQAKIAAG